jgi:hypothetical protein
MNDFFFVNRPLILLLKNEIENKYYNEIHSGRKLVHDLYTLIEGVFFICRTGIQRNMCKYKNIQGSAIMYHFYKWSKDHIFDICWKKIYNIYQSKIKYKKNLKSLSIDCTYIKSINGVDCVGRNPTDRGRNGNKISILVDLLGAPVGYVMSTANRHDKKLFKKTIQDRICHKKTKSKLYADKGYSCKGCKDDALNQNFSLICKNKSNAKNLLFPVNIKVEHVRYVVEALNSWLKSYRKIILRFEKKIKYYMSFMLLAFSCIINKKITKNGHVDTFLKKHT